MENRLASFRKRGAGRDNVKIVVAMPQKKPSSSQESVGAVMAISPWLSLFLAFFCPSIHTTMRGNLIIPLSLHADLAPTNTLDPEVAVIKPIPETRQVRKGYLFSLKTPIGQESLSTDSCED